MKRCLGALLALALVAGCSDDDEQPEPGPDPGPTTTTAAVDRSGIALAPVSGETTTTIRETGTARLVGTVRGPAGPVAGAVVRIERLVAAREIRTDVLTGPDGAFVLDAVPGGRYRVRAFQAPAFAQLEPEVRFLADGEEHAFDLVVEDHTGLVVRPAIAPNPASLDDPVNLVVLVAQRRVADDGVLRTSPVTGLTVELVGLGRWILRDSGGGGTTTSTSLFGRTTSTTTRELDPVARTDGSGRVRYELVCRVPGEPGLGVRVPVTVAPAAPQPPTPGETTTTTTTTAARPQTRLETISLDLPACVDPVATTTTTGATTTSAGEPDPTGDG